MSFLGRDQVYIDFKRVGDDIGIQIQFEYGIDGFDDLRSIIKSNGGKWDDVLNKWVVNGDFAFYSIDLIQSLDQFDVNFSDYLSVYLKNELRKMERNIQMSKAVKPSKKIDVPVPLGKSLFEFQKAVIEFFNLRGGRILLADDMGLGKTISSIAIANYHKFEKILIICPDTAKDKVWGTEISEWLIGDHSVHIVRDGKDWKNANVVIINYDLLAKHEASIIDHKFDYVIVDEAHNLKTTGTKRTKSAKKICGKIKNVALLTGTPIMNRPIELYSILRILMDGAFGNKQSYAFRYCDGKIIETDENGKRHVISAGLKKDKDWNKEDGKKNSTFYMDDRGHSNLNELNFKLRSTCMIRREKYQVINEFPNVYRHVFQIQSEYSKEIDQKYKAEKSRYLNELLDLKANKNKFFDYRSYTRAVGEIKRYHFDQISLIRKELGVRKVPDIAKFVQKIIDQGTEKIVLFIHHREVAEELNCIFAGFSVVLYGGMSPLAKMKAINAFENNEDIKILIGSIATSGVAFTLTVSHTVVFGELDWTPSMVDQCECRCARLGQKKDVTVYYLIVNNSLDQNMLAKIHKKGKMIKKVML